MLVDRLSRRLTMLVSDVLHASLLGVALALLLSGRLELGHLYLVSGLFGLLSAFFLPAAMSITPQLVPRDVLPQANATRSFASELVGILGPPLGGVLVTAGGLAFALGFDALTFAVGALCLLAVRPRPLERADDAPGTKGYWRELGEGFRYVAGSSWLWVTTLLFAFGNIFSAGALVVLLPLLADARFAGAASLGWLLSATAGGALVAALVLNRVTLRRRGWAAYLAVATVGLGLAGVALAPGIGLGVVAMAVVGAGLTVFGVVWETTMQALVPEAVLGRVVSLDMLGSFALLPVGFLLTGGLAEQVGVAPLILLYGLATVGLAVIGLLVPAVRRLN